MRFEWDAGKAAANLRKHGISFDLASQIFAGDTLTVDEQITEDGEYREVSMGVAGNLLILVVVHTDRNGAIRIISARKANRREAREYDDYHRKNIG